MHLIAELGNSVASVGCSNQADAQDQTHLAPVVEKLKRLIGLPGGPDFAYK